MTLPDPPRAWNTGALTSDRVRAVAAFGFTERQARFPVTHPEPMDFRVFLLRHAELLRSVVRRPT
jgi:hypothetical protein